MAAPKTVDEYLAALPDDRRAIMERIRGILLDAVPGGEERIRYGMPAVMLNQGRYALHYAAWKKHIGLYPVARADEPLETAIAPHRSGEDTVTFPYTAPIDYDLIARIAAHCAARAPKD